MNTNMKEINMKQLTLDEMEQANGACFWCIGAIVWAAAVYSGIGYLAYLNEKDK